MALWTPEYIGTALWLDAADSSFITLDSGKVSNWNDKSGMFNHATQSDPSLRPSISSAALNSLDVLNFTGHPMHLTLTNGLPTPISIFAVWRCTNSPASLLQTMRVGGVDNNKMAYYRGGSGFTFASYQDNILNLSQAMDTSEYAITHAQNDGSNGAVSVNGGTVVSGAMHPFDSTAPKIALDDNTLNRSLIGQIAEIIAVPSSVSSSVRDIIIGYLAHKWGLTANLPAEHTYKTNAPLTLSVSGTITDRDGNPTQRKVYAMSRPTDATAPLVLAHALSDPTTGAYELVVPSGEEVTVVAVSEDDADPLLNDKVYRVIPA